MRIDDAVCPIRCGSRQSWTLTTSGRDVQLAEAAVLKLEKETKL
jgi:hypothetical protein